MLRKKPEGESKDEQKRRELASGIWNEARDAKEAGQTIFSFAFELGLDRSFAGLKGSRSYASPDALISEIEKLGWRLEHVDHVHVPLGSGSFGGMAGTSTTAANGVTIGHYYFRSA